MGLYDLNIDGLEKDCIEYEVDTNKDKDGSETYIRYSRMVHVTDNWCGNYELEGRKDGIEVAVTFFEVKNGDKGTFTVKVYAAGNDDTAMEICKTIKYDKRIRKMKKKAAMELFKWYRKHIFFKVPNEGTNMEWFAEHGFLVS